IHPRHSVTSGLSAAAPRAGFTRPLHDALPIFAEEILLSRGGADIGRVTPTLSAASIDLNPHQLEAAIFALESLPFGGCILGDERSEEHTSELQSRENLVCRLLLEKKNALQRPL